MTTPIPIPESQRKSDHDTLQSHLKGIADRYTAVANTTSSGPTRAMARLMGSYVGTVAAKAKASFKAGGNPALDNHIAIVASAEQHLMHLGASAQTMPPDS